MRGLVEAWIHGTGEYVAATRERRQRKRGNGRGAARRLLANEVRIGGYRYGVCVAESRQISLLMCFPAEAGKSAFSGADFGLGMGVWECIFLKSKGLWQA